MEKVKEWEKWDKETLESFVEWLILNPELFDKYYPELSQELTTKIQESEPFESAILIQKLPTFFPQWKAEFDQLLGATKKKRIEAIVRMIDKILNVYQYPTEIEQNAVESVRDELTEQLKYWKKQIEPPKADKPGTGFDCHLNENQLQKLFNILRQDDNYIDSLTEFRYFKAAFRPVKLPPDFKPIRWTTDIVKLQYLVKEYLLNNPGTIWKILSTLFIDSDEGYRKPENLKSNYSQAGQRYPEIDAIMKSILNG